MDEANRAPVDRTPAAPRAGVSPQLLIVLGALALTALLYWPTSLEIVELWGDTGRRIYTHGWIVMAVSLWLIWQDRAALGVIGLTPPTAGWVPVAVFGVTLVVTGSASLLLPSVLSLPLLALCTIWAVGGRMLACRVMLPVLLLYFALPVWDWLNPLLQRATAVVNLRLTELVGIPVAMDGNVIHIPVGWFEVAGGCSGLHFFIVALAIATIDGHLGRDRLAVRCLLVAVAAALAAITNWVRVFCIILAGHFGGMQHYLVSGDHYTFGWVLFAVAILVYLAVTTRIRRAPNPDISFESTHHASESARIAVVAAMSVLALSLGPVWGLVREVRASKGMPETAPALTGWSGPYDPITAWQPVFAGADQEFLVGYSGEAGDEFLVFKAIYGFQRPGKELLDYYNTVVGSEYLERNHREFDLPLFGTSAVVAERTAAATDGREILIWSLYALDGQPSTLQRTDRMRYAVRSLTRSTHAELIAIATYCQPDCLSRRRALEEFSIQAMPQMLSASAVDGESIVHDLAL